MYPHGWLSVPPLFAKETKGIKLDGSKAIVIDMEKNSVDDVLVHDETDLDLAHIIANLTEIHGMF